jgi:hypothetical protein
VKPTFFDGYLECAIWASVDDNGSPLDRSDAELSDSTRLEMQNECAAFESENRALLDQANEEGISDEYLGHDFWLTRNHHGTGFWDRGLSVGQALTDAAHAAGERTLCIGDDGKIYQFRG